MKTQFLVLETYFFRISMINYIYVKEMVKIGDTFFWWKNLAANKMDLPIC